MHARRRSFDRTKFIKFFRWSNDSLSARSLTSSNCENTVHGSTRSPRTVWSHQNLSTYPFALSPVEGLRESFHTSVVRGWQIADSHFGQRRFTARSTHLPSGSCTRWSESLSDFESISAE